MEEDEPNHQFRREERKEISTATELYIMAREKMMNATNEYEYYRNLVESIEIGSSILGGDIAKKVNRILSEPGNYLEKFNVSYQDRNVYQLSSGNERMGKVTCRPEELPLAQESVREQLSSQIISKLKPLSNEIFNLLLSEGYILTVTIEKEYQKKILEELE